MEDLSRRYFLSGATAVAGLTIAGRALVSYAETPALRARREIKDLVSHYPDELEKFKAGIVALQGKAAGSQTAWYANANFHAGRCGTHAPQFEVHKTLNFYPWHRGFLLATELNMQALLKDDSVSIPYWEWPRGVQDGNKVTIPEQFTKQPLAHPRDSNELYLEEVLYRKNLDSANVFVGSVSPGPVQAIQQIGFGGYSLSPSLNSAIESVPHNAVHNGIGGDMGDLKWSPLDPLFYGHHGNLDRLWEVWRSDEGKRKTEPWDDHDFGTQVFEYFDVTLMATRYFPIAMARDISALGYRYAPIGEAPTPGAAMVAMSESSAVPSESDLAGQIASGLATVLPRVGPNALETTGSKHAILTLSGIEVPTNTPVTAAIYLARSKPEDFRPSDAVFAGVMAFQADTERQVTSFALDISEALNRLGNGPVYVVVLGLRGRRSTPLTIRSFSISQ